MIDDTWTDEDRRRTRFVLDERWQTAEAKAISEHGASPRGAQPAEQASGETSPTRGISREALLTAWDYDERHTLTIPAQPAGECGHITARRWYTATGEWCDDCYVLAVRVLGGRP